MTTGAATRKKTPPIQISRRVMTAVSHGGRGTVEG